MPMPVFGRAARRAAVAVAALALLLEGGGFAMARSYASMSCYQLWYARNSIYAARGYCFKTAKAKAVFGPGCFPPYGKLTSSQQGQVADIQYWEGRKGCS
jgi:YARHG domain